MFQAISCFNLKHKVIRSCIAMQVELELEILILTTMYEMFVEFNVQYYFHNKITFYVHSSKQYLLAVVTCRIF
jgi:hypothetical protein